MEQSCVIGVDVGGTHTDVAVMAGERLARGKALTTYDDFSRGLIEAIDVAAGRLDASLESLLSRTSTIFNATTVVTNSISELRGDRVGVLVTAGFPDVFRISGGPRLPLFDDHLQRNVPDLVERDAIAEVKGRIDAEGNELVPLDVDGLERAVDHLVDEIDVDALAICFMSSYANPSHELQAEELIHERHPDLFVSTSHRLFPVMRETRRWTTAVLNSFVQANAERYLETIHGRLADFGFDGTLAFFQGLGSGITKKRAAAFPLALLGSGPAAGALGANELARRMGHENILLGDMGGTSFDTCLIRANDIRIEKNVELGQFQTGLNLVDVVSIGAGGGSIVSVSERGVPQVGPRSASSTPGPACYGKGGTEATVTDAMLTLGLIDAANYLGGRMALHPDKAAQALRESLGDRFDWSAEEAAVAVHDLVVANMSNAIREVSVRKGHDPRDFVFFAYGGTLPMFAWQIAEAVGIDEVIVPEDSSVFCAEGLVGSDFALRRDQSLVWSLADLDSLDRVNETIEGIVETAIEEMEADGFKRESLTISRYADLKFPGQVFELTVPVPDRLTRENVAELIADFHRTYERTYGKGTAWAGSQPAMHLYTVAVSSAESKPEVAKRKHVHADAEARCSERQVFLPSTKAFETVPVLPASQFEVGAEHRGPLIVDAVDTTLFVPPGVAITRDEYMSYRLSRKEA